MVERVEQEWADRTGRGVRLVQVRRWRIGARRGDGDAKTWWSRPYATEAEARAEVAAMLERGDERGAAGWKDLTAVTR